MKKPAFSMLAIGVAFLSDFSAASPECQASLPSRPSVVAAPYAPAIPHYKSPARNSQVCYVRALGNGKDDSLTFFSALKACNNGGTVYLPDPLYTIGTALDLTFLNGIDVILAGNISFTTDIAYWTGHTFQYAFQGTAVLWQWGGFDVNLYGGGTIDGNGQAWWDVAVTNTTLQRPVMTGLVNLTSSTISHIHERNPPNWFNFISGAKDLLISDMNFQVAAVGVNPAKNTDGWDTYRSDSVVIQNSVVSNTDDCVSFKPNSTNVIVQGLQCTGSHGISVGSLGQYIGEVDIVENIYVYNVSMINSGTSARIKVFQDAIPNADGSIPTSSGGGSGYVRNVTYTNMHDTSDDYAIQITQCYGTSNQTLCNQYPSKMIIEDILFDGFSGTSSTHYDPIVGTLVCSAESVSDGLGRALVDWHNFTNYKGMKVCPNIVAKNINITTPSGKTAQWTCVNVNRDTLAINCI